MEYSIIKGLYKIKYVLIIILPFAIDMFVRSFPEMAGMTISEIINYLLNLIYPQLGSLSVAAILTILLNYLGIRKTIMGKYKTERLKRLENGN